ncbi:MAG TPA: 4-hydroxy-3-methylbut-2-enyl diphosphate reductase [Bacteroidota bacterium]
MLERIILASPRGFCAGVERAIEVVEKALEIYGKPIYVKHQIVHNEYVVRSLEEKGAIFVEELENVPRESYVIFSAHGVSPVTRAESQRRSLKVIDATCPLVTKVHLEALKYQKDGYSMVLVGHRGHQEVNGTMGVAPMVLVERAEDVAKVNVEDHDKVACLTQTTLSMDDTGEIIKALRKRFPNMVTPPSSDICYATQNRQNAVKELAKRCDLILVVGSEMSSNSKRLVETAVQKGTPAYLIPDKNAIQTSWLKDIRVAGVTSGASVPDILVDEVIGRLKKTSANAVAVELLEVLKEDVEFGLPKEVQGTPVGIQGMS